MPSKSVPLSNTKFMLVNRVWSCLNAPSLTLLIFLALFVTAGVTQSPPAQKPQSQRIIVKMKPNLARELETDFPSTISLEQMHLSASQARGPHQQAFMKRYSVHQLTPMYPGMIRARKQHGW